MSTQLENEARAAYEKIPAEGRATMGGCIGALPDADDLQDYLVQLRGAWLSGWCNRPGRYPHLLLRLYHCVAFLRYEGNAFWASFGEAVGDSGIASAPSRQTQINDAFADIARYLGLKVMLGIDRARHLYVQSAVRHVGIPVRVWRGFVEVCERLFVEPEDWRQWPDERWEDAIHLWLGGRKNLRAFFVENRPTARKWIDEMLEARLVLDKNPDWTLDDVAQISHLRPEYFDEVPETAIFLRPIETETLFRDRPRLRLRWQPGVAAFHLETPRLKDEGLLPSDWHVLAQRVAASTNPVSIPLHRGAFTQDLALKLVRAEKELAAYRLRGLSPWGLWSESSGAFISLQARELPMDDYVLVSRSPLAFTNRDGWLADDADEIRWNQETQMPDSSTCFVSRLVPDARRATLEVVGWHRITFAPRARLELRVFPRVTERFFLTFTPPKSVALPTWPRFVVKAPKGLLAHSADETETLLQNEFRFFADDIVVPGNWRHDEDASRHLDGEDVFFYRVREDWLPPTHNARPTRVLRDFHDLGSIEPPAPKPHELTIQLRAARHGIILFGDSPEIHFRKEPPLSVAHAEKLSVSFRDYPRPTDDEDGEAADGKLLFNPDQAQWCATCGKRTQSTHDACNCGGARHSRQIEIFHRQCPTDRGTEALESDLKHLLPQCPNCLARNTLGVEPVRRLSETDDETGIAAAIPLSHFDVSPWLEKNEWQVRKLLCFADQRQKAAAFPSLLEDEMFPWDFGREVVRMARKAGRPLRFTEVAKELAKRQEDETAPVEDKLLLPVGIQPDEENPDWQP